MRSSIKLKVVLDTLDRLHDHAANFAACKKKDAAIAAMYPSPLPIMKPDTSEKIILPLMAP